MFDVNHFLLINLFTILQLVREQRQRREREREGDRERLKREGERETIWDPRHQTLNQTILNKYLTLPNQYGQSGVKGRNDLTLWRELYRNIRFGLLDKEQEQNKTMFRF